MMRRWPRWLGWARDPEQERRVRLVAGASVFAGLPRRLLRRLCAGCFEKGYAAGDVVFYEGELAKALFVVLDGAVEISQATPDGDVVVRTLGPGSCFGELALIDDLPRSATARVVAAARLLILYRTDFDALVEGNRGIALVVFRNLLRMLALYTRRFTPPLPERTAGIAATQAPGPGQSPDRPLPS